MDQTEELMKRFGAELRRQIAQQKRRDAMNEMDGGPPSNSQGIPASYPADDTDILASRH